MRKLFILLLVVCFALSSVLVVSADEIDYSSMTFTESAYYIDGSYHQIGISSKTGLYYYFINGIYQVGNGLVFVNGNYYYVRSSGQLAINQSSYWASTTNGLLPQTGYAYDSQGRLIDPPYYPDNWESEWASEWPFPTDPPETEPPTEPPPATDPAVLDPGDDPVPFSPVWGFDLLNQALQFGTDLWSTVMESTGLWPYFSAVVFLLLLARFLLRPVFGSGLSLGAGRSDRASDRRKDE